jgi:iron-sulfur cluster assembly accessory protein
MITITDLAKEKIIDVLISEKSNVLRFGLQGGGCNGFQYFFSAEAEIEEGDTEYPLDDNHVLVVDNMSAMYLENAEIDYRRDIMGESFVFNNPNTTTKCGCGSSVGF